MIPADIRCFYDYVPGGEEKLFTAVYLPGKGEKFPAVLIRTPYVDAQETMTETEALTVFQPEALRFVRGGFAVVWQHCRGRGLSSGECIPCLNERQDSLALQDWVRRQPFYDGRLLLWGASYLTLVHYAAAPFAPDVKGAFFAVMDDSYYDLCYRNGFLKTGLYGSWYVSMYRAKAHLPKHYTPASFDLLPLSAFSRTVFGEEAADFDRVLQHPDPADDFWQTAYGDVRHVAEQAEIPILFATGFYDIVTGGMLEMWRRLSPACRARSAMLISPYDHGDAAEASPIRFPAGTREQGFGKDHDVRWLRWVCGMEEHPPVPTGQVSYYRLFENRWATDDFASDGQLTLPLSGQPVTYPYDPFDAPSFPGGMCTNFGGAAYQPAPGARRDVVTVYTPPLDADTFVKGEMRLTLPVRSDCEDTCFAVRISVPRDGGDFGLRDDITSLCRQVPDYAPGSEAVLEFSFDPHAFLLRRGERLRVDIASADKAHYVRHTNQKGLYSAQATARIAHNTVDPSRAVLTLETEVEE